jgi:predicted ATPase
MRNSILDRFVVISGCSGGGKSSVLRELNGRGFATVEEPGRRIVADEIDRGGQALPWIDAYAFIRRALDMSMADLALAQQKAGWVFFDRGLIDAAAGLERLTGAPASVTVRGSPRFNRQVFLTPAWPEIYVTDQERRHSFDEAMLEYVHLLEVYPLLGYEVNLLPKTHVSERADFILHTIST